MTRVLLVSSEEAHHEGVALGARRMEVSRCAPDPALVGEAVIGHARTWSWSGPRPIGG